MSYSKTSNELHVHCAHKVDIFVEDGQLMVALVHNSTGTHKAHRNVHLIRGVEWVHGLFLFPPCFKENVVATCKIGSFLCSLDNLLQKNVIVLFFGNQISKWCSFEKRAIFDLLFTFFSHQGKVTKIPSAHISLIYIHIFCLLY